MCMYNFLLQKHMYLKCAVVVVVIWKLNDLLLINYIVGVAMLFNWVWCAININLRFFFLLTYEGNQLQNCEYQNDCNVMKICMIVFGFQFSWIIEHLWFHLREHELRNTHDFCCWRHIPILLLDSKEFHGFYVELNSDCFVRKKIATFSKCWTIYLPLSRKFMNIYLILALKFKQIYRRKLCLMIFKYKIKSKK